KSGNGALTLTASAASLVDGAQINVAAGTLNSNNATALGALARVDVASSATFSLGASQTVGTLTSSGGVSLNGSTPTVGGANHLTSAFSGVIADGSAAGGLTKAGTGDFTLSGNNTYTGTTTVLSGRLLLAADSPAGAAGALGAGTSAVIVGATSGSADAAL